MRVPGLGEWMTFLVTLVTRFEQCGRTVLAREGEQGNVIWALLVWPGSLLGVNVKSYHQVPWVLSGWFFGRPTITARESLTLANALKDHLGVKRMSQNCQWKKWEKCCVAALQMERQRDANISWHSLDDLFSLGLFGSWGSWVNTKWWTKFDGVNSCFQGSKGYALNIMPAAYSVESLTLLGNVLEISPSHLVSVFIV